MTYNNESPKPEKPIPSIEYSLKNIGWNIKVIADCLTKLVEIQSNKVNSQQNYKSNNNNHMPF